MTKRFFIYTDVRMETVFVDRPFGFCYFDEDQNKTVWTHHETMGM